MTTIRPATGRDAAAIAHVWHAAWGDGHAGHVPDGLLAHRRPEHFAARAAGRVDHSWVAEVDAGPFAYEAGTDEGTFVVPCHRYEVRTAGYGVDCR